MNIHILSDIHLEFGALSVPVTSGEETSILVLAGDVGIAAKSWTFGPFLQEMSSRFQDVIYIMGNHEHYDGSILRSIEKIKRELQYLGGIHNVHVVNNEVVRIHNISFVCSTMWASYDKGNPNTLYQAGLWMNDHKLIRTGTSAEPYLKKFKPDDAYEEFLDAVNFIFPAIKEEKEKGQKVVVVTHMAPSFESVHEKYRTGPYAMLNGAYASNLDYEIIEAKPDLWVHGHTHESFDYNIEETRVVCNPRGYFGHELNPSFNPALRITLE